jgi:hypothetical protein
MDEVTREIASRYLPQIRQLGPEKPELFDAALHGTEIIIIILCDGRKLRFETTSDDLSAVTQAGAPRPPAERAGAERKTAKAFEYIEEEVKAIQAETKPKKGKTKS